MTKKSRNKGMGFLNAGFYIQDQHVASYASNYYVAKNPVDIVSYLATNVS